MNTHTQEHHEHRDGRLAAGLVGLLVGALAGAGLAMWLVPRLRSELRQRVTDAATTARVRVGQAADELVRRGGRVRDDVADAVVRGAREVERHAAAAKSDPGAATAR